MDGIWLKFLFYTRTLFEQCTYLGYFLLEAPREYVQHGPLLSINWLRLCPQFGARIRSHAVRRRLFTVLMTAASFTSIIHHITRTIIYFIYMTHSHFHSFGSSWQAGCLRSFESDTLTLTLFSQLYSLIWP
jgi:hypothetical protein